MFQLFKFTFHQKAQISSVTSSLCLHLILTGHCDLVDKADSFNSPIAYDDVCGNVMDTLQLQKNHTTLQKLLLKSFSSFSHFLDTTCV